MRLLKRLSASAEDTRRSRPRVRGLTRLEGMVRGGRGGGGRKAAEGAVGAGMDAMVMGSLMKLYALKCMPEGEGTEQRT